jgi:hypothetical protein
MTLDTEPDTQADLLAFYRTSKPELEEGLWNNYTINVTNDLISKANGSLLLNIFKSIETGFIAKTNYDFDKEIKKYFSFVQKIIASPNCSRKVIHKIIKENEDSSNDVFYKIFLYISKNPNTNSSIISRIFKNILARDICFDSLFYEGIEELISRDLLSASLIKDIYRSAVGTVNITVDPFDLNVYEKKIILLFAKNKKTPISILKQIVSLELSKVITAEAQKNLENKAYIKAKYILEHKTVPASTICSVSDPENVGVMPISWQNVDIIQNKLDKKTYEEKLALASSSDTDMVTLEKLSNYKIDNINIRLAKNPNASNYLLKKLSNDLFLDIQREILNNPNASKELIQKIIKNSEKYPSSSLYKAAQKKKNELEKDLDLEKANDLNTSRIELEKLSRSVNYKTRARVARNPSTTYSVLSRLAHDEHPFVIDFLFQNKNISVELLKAILKNPNLIKDQVKFAQEKLEELSSKILEAQLSEHINSSYKASEGLYTASEGLYTDKALEFIAHPQCSEKILSKIIDNNQNSVVFSAVLKHKECTLPILSKMAWSNITDSTEKDKLSVRHEIINHPLCNKDVLEKTKQINSSEEIRISVKEKLRFLQSVELETEVFSKWEKSSYLDIKEELLRLNECGKENSEHVKKIILTLEDLLWKKNMFHFDVEKYKNTIKEIPQPNLENHLANAIEEKENKHASEEAKDHHAKAASCIEEEIKNRHDFFNSWFSKALETRPKYDPLSSLNEFKECFQYFEDLQKNDLPKFKNKVNAEYFEDTQNIIKKIKKEIEYLSDKTKETKETKETKPLSKEEITKEQLAEIEKILEKSFKDMRIIGKSSVSCTEDKINNKLIFNIKHTCDLPISSMSYAEMAEPKKLIILKHRSVGPMTTTAKDLEYIAQTFNIGKPDIVQPISLEESKKESFQKKVGLRICCELVSDCTKNVLLNIINKAFPKDSSMHNVFSNLLDNNFGQALVCVVLGLGLPYIQKVHQFDQESINELTKEFQIQAATQTGKEIIDILMLYFLPVIQKSLENYENANSQNSFEVLEQISNQS